MMLSNKVYDILKWLVVLFIPALTSAYVGLASVWGLPMPEEVAKTSAIVCTFLGAILGISCVEYKKMEDIE